MIAPARVPDLPTLADRLLLRADEAAAALGISERTLAAMVKAGEIQHAYIGRRNLRFNVKALQAWIDGKTVMPAEMGVTRPEQQQNLAGFSGEPQKDATRAANSPPAT